MTGALLRGLLRALLIIVVVLVPIGVGLVRFADGLPPPTGDTSDTDAIVVLTGGGARITTGLALLEAGKGKRLFVSGVHPGVGIDDLLRIDRSPSATTPAGPGLAARIDLGDTAGDTFGNSVETVEWMRANHYRSMRLVTANYHMPRALVEFRMEAPDIRIVPNPVHPPGVDTSRWWRDRATFGLLLGEYGKYLIARWRYIVSHVAAETSDFITRVRSAVFSLAFPLWTALCCIVLAFGTLLPRKGTLAVAIMWVRSVAWIERAILGLDYRVIGRENLPRPGAFIVAAKHQSTYETMKIHLLLNDPAIVLKKELLRIPIWGRFLTRTGMIPIDRGSGRRAVGEMLVAAEKAKAEERPIVIFPQGTRVAPGNRRQYKMGVIALYDALDLPIVPLALNSGLFWPKHGPKRGGTVTFSFLPPIAPGLEPEAVLAMLEERMEAETDRLLALIPHDSTGPLTVQEASHT